MVSENTIDFDRVRNRMRVTPHNSIFMTGQYHNLPHLSSAPSKTPVKTTLLTLTTKIFFSKFLICPFQDQERQPKVHPGLKPLSMLSANHWTALILRAQQTVSHLKTNLQINFINVPKLSILSISFLGSWEIDTPVDVPVAQIRINLAMIGKLQQKLNLSFHPIVCYNRTNKIHC